VEINKSSGNKQAAPHIYSGWVLLKCRNGIFCIANPKLQ
jgi:hypothetical protein